MQKKLFCADARGLKADKGIYSQYNYYKNNAERRFATIVLFNYSNLSKGEHPPVSSTKKKLL